MNKLIHKELLFLGILLLLAFFFYHDLLHAFPMNMHLWRQTDSISFAMLYKKGVPFFEPEQYRLWADDFSTGKTVGEFPLIYYIVGKLWKIFGESIAIFRGLQMFILLAGIFAVYKSAYLILKNYLAAGFVALLVFSSPVLAFYGVSFAMNGTAWAVTFIGTYFYLIYRKKKPEKMYLIESFFFFFLGGLLKITALMFPLAFAGVRLTEIITKKEKIKYEDIFFWGGIFLVVGGWYFGFVPYYNNLHGYSYTANTTFPIWELDKEGWLKYIDKLFGYHLKMFYNYPVLILTGVMAPFIVFFLRKKLPAELYFFTLFLYLETFAYFLLRGKPLSVHDYYWIAFVPAVAVTFLVFLYFLIHNHSPIYYHTYTKTLFVGFTVYNIIYAKEVLRLKQFPEKVSRTWVSQGFINWNIAYQADVKKFLYPYYEMRDSLQKWGIQKEDKILSLSDPGMNITLYFLDRKGWTKVYDEEIGEYILQNRHPDWLFIRKEDRENYPYVWKYVRDSITEYKGIAVYKLSK